LAPFLGRAGYHVSGIEYQSGVRATVAIQLRKEVGDILVGRAAAALRTVSPSFTQVFTAKTGLATGELSAARKELSRLETLLSDKRSELAQLGQEVAALETALVRRDNSPIQRWRERLEKAKQKLSWRPARWRFWSNSEPSGQ